MIPLYDHQIKFLKKNPNKAMLVHGLGSGKTRSAIEWAKRRTGRALIVCPKGLKENWRRECETWGLTLYTIVSKEEFKRDAKKFTQRVVIVDEADHFFSAHFKSALSKALRWYIKAHDPALLMLSGTPYRSSAWNIYVAGSFLGYEWNYRNFEDKFFTHVRMGHRMIPKPRAGSEPVLRALVERISDVFNIEEGFDIPPQVDETVFSGEGKEQGEAHKDNIEIAPIVRFTRNHQIEAGIGVSPEDDNKLELIKGYAEEVDKVAVVCRYREQLATYARVLEDEGHTVYQMHGDVAGRSLTLDAVEDEERCILLIQSATCEGWEAPSVGLMVFASMDYSYRNYVQVRGRILRMNRLKKNVYVHLVAGEADRAIMKAMESKKDFDVLAYMQSQ